MSFYNNKFNVDTLEERLYIIIMLTETVTEVNHINSGLFSFKTTRSASFRFEAGEFTMIGLPGTKLFRAYSMVSGPGEDYLEFLSVIVPDGPLTSKLKDIKVGDSVTVAPKATGTLLADILTPKTNLWMIATGTGIAPFVSICRDPATYTRFNKIFVCHTVRQQEDLAYRDFFMYLTAGTETPRLQYFPTTTRDSTFPNTGRITDLIDSGKVFEALQTDPWKPETDSVMICGGPDFNRQMIDTMKQGGWTVGSHSAIGNFVYEKAFAA